MAIYIQNHHSMTEVTYKLEGLTAEFPIPSLEVIRVGNTPDCQIVVPQINLGAILFYLYQDHRRFEVAPGHLDANVRLNSKPLYGRSTLHQSDTVEAHGIKLIVSYVGLGGHVNSFPDGAIGPEQSPLSQIDREALSLQQLILAEDFDAVSFEAGSVPDVLPRRRRRSAIKRCRICLKQLVQDPFECADIFLYCTACEASEIGRHKQLFAPEGFDLVSRIVTDKGPGWAYRANNEGGQTVYLRVIDARYFSSTGTRDSVLRALAAYKKGLFEHRSVPSDVTCLDVISHLLVAEPWFEGVCLAELDSSQRMTWKGFVPVLVRLLEVLVVAHDKGIYHGYLDRGRVFYRTKNGCESEVLLRGFGLSCSSKSRDIGLLSVEQLEDCRRELPAQILKEESEIHVDLFHLGTVAYEVLSGRKSFLAVDAFCEGPERFAGLKPLKDLKPEIPSELTEFVHRLLEPEIHNRHQSAKEALAELQELRLNE